MSNVELAKKLFSLMIEVNNLDNGLSNQNSVYGDIANALKKIKEIDYDESIESGEIILSTITAQWQAQNIDKAQYIGIIEFQSDDQEWHNFEVVKTETHLVFGGACNIGLLQSGYMLIDACFSIDENLQELIEDLEVYYRDGPGYTSDIVCNERM